MDSIPQNQPDPQPPDNADGEAFLSHLQVSDRGVIANWFYQAARRGDDQTPEGICRYVDDLCYQRNEREYNQRCDDCHYTIKNHVGAALSFARYVIWREALPDADRRAEKARRRKPFAREAATLSMAGKPVTEAQLRYLHNLGHTGKPPADRAEASALIDQLANRGRR